MSSYCKRNVPHVLVAYLLFAVYNESNSVYHRSLKRNFLSRHGDEQMHCAFVFYTPCFLAHPFDQLLALVAQDVPLGSDEEGSWQRLQGRIAAQAHADGRIVGIGTERVGAVESFHDFSVQPEAFAVLLPRCRTIIKGFRHGIEQQE